ncbi:MAG: aminotransferase class V-fold PLP-dependent enzyme [Leptospiraceae bacterium]|nr:aminotransferase class V-fold PLP-dependent enzyme [Leptospiraceae bacterium]MDW7976135.1 aminotransferase class V-fold PLP-dependent enzyme [Leptospiraceae bacterium]
MDQFPFKNKYIYLNFCGVSPLYEPARRKKQEFENLQSQLGALVFLEYPNVLKQFHESVAKLLKTSEKNISFVKNTAEGLSLIANGYPFESDKDEILSFVFEYPSNHYPWKLQERKQKAKFKIIPNTKSVLLNPEEVPDGFVYGFSMQDIEKIVTKHTKIIAISHVQFTSGFAANLKELGDFCKTHNIDLIVDAAQSLGVIPLYPEEWNISAIAASGWKWLLGPLGSGILYTSEKFRNKIELMNVGAEVMIQGQDYLNHTWQPHTDGRKFEYSTISYSDVIALTECIEGLILPYSPEKIFSHIQKLHQIFKEIIKKNKHILIPEFPFENRSGILSAIVKNPQEVAQILRKHSLVCTVRGNYLRIAPHIMITEEEIQKAAETLLKIVNSQ